MADPLEAFATSERYLVNASQLSSNPGRLVNQTIPTPCPVQPNGHCRLPRENCWTQRASELIMQVSAAVTWSSRTDAFGGSSPVGNGLTATTRKPIWSCRRSGSNLTRKADRQGQPSSAQPARADPRCGILAPQVGVRASRKRGVIRVLAPLEHVSAHQTAAKVTQTADRT